MTKFEKKYANISLSKFLEYIENEDLPWLIKRLSGNDTGITGGHQSGLYIPGVFMKKIVPEVVTTSELNPTTTIDCVVSSHDCYKSNIQAKYYNNKFFSDNGSRNEFRLTRWTETPLQEIENTGAICIIAGVSEEERHLICWVSRTSEEENEIEAWIGCEIEPGQMYYSGQNVNETLSDSIKKQIPKEWEIDFPTTKEIFNLVEKLIPQGTWHKSPDDLLLKRRLLEFRIFKYIEYFDVWSRIQSGYKNVDQFIKHATSVVNRRKSRSGTSLELNLSSIFNHQRISFDLHVVTELNKVPDFIFPSNKAYHDLKFPEMNLSMLAAKTCCKDRWRQVLNEANRIKVKHLFTLQEGVSPQQLLEMKTEGVVLVIPEAHRHLFPINNSDHLINLSEFIEMVKKKEAHG